MKLLGVAGALVVVLGAACTGDQSGVAVHELEDRAFVSSSVTEDGRPVGLAPGTRLSMRFGADRWLSATAGCNEMSAQVATVEDGRLELEADRMSSTSMLCEPLVTQERWFGSLLGGEPSIDVRPGHLVLTAGDRRVEFTEMTGDSRAALVGPTWVVEAVVDAGEVTALSAEPRREIVFHDDGRFSSRVGCVGVDGTLEYERGTVRVSGGSAVGCPPGPDDAWLGLEGGRLTVERSGDVVRLRADRGSGLDLRAAG